MNAPQERTDPMPESDPILEGRELGLQLDHRWLWRNLSFSLYPGEIIGIRGRSGSGKSMLFRAMVGLTPLSEGTVLFHGKSMQELHPPAFRKQVMLVTQKSAMAPGTVQDNLDIVFRFHAHNGLEKDEEKISAFLDAFGLDPSFLHRDADTLSGGEGQIVALLRALQLDPHVLLLDEPTSSMDPHSVDSAEGLLQKWLQAAEDRCILWISHDPGRLGRISSRMLPFEEAIP
jgi:putative ABC transport system ATP-binding protein